MKEERQIFRQEFGKLKKIDFSELKEGDYFRIVDKGPEEKNYQNGETLFVATSDPYKNKEGIMTVDTNLAMEIK